MDHNILLIGHRGANSEAPENTLKSFRKAIELGADYIEFDIHLTKDEKIVIIHDETTQRTSGTKGNVKEMTIDQIKNLDVGEGERIPILQDLIKIAKDRINLQIEVKAVGLSEQLVDILQQENLVDNSIISSFNHQEVMKTHNYEPNLKIGALLPVNQKWPKDWKEIRKLIDQISDKGFYSLHLLYLLIDQKLIDYAHKKNLKVIGWTVDSRTAMKKLINYGIDGIITNDLKKAKKVLNR